MSLINTQLIAMRRIEIADLQTRLRDEIEPALERDNNKKTLAAKRTAEQRIAILVKEISKMQADNDVLEAAQAAQQAAKNAAEQAKRDADEARRPKEMILDCCDCKGEFTFSVDKQRLFKRNGWELPPRCEPCRAERKANRLQAQTLTCCDCNAEFNFSVKQQLDFKEKGFDAPKRCRDCKQAKKTAAEAFKPTLINCGDCHADFTFTSGAQKFHKEKGWSNPKWCPPCRTKRRSDGASTHSTRTPVTASA